MKIRIKDNDLVDLYSGEVIGGVKPKFLDANFDKNKKDGIKAFSTQDAKTMPLPKIEALLNEGAIIEWKYDGHRGMGQLLAGGNRLFSRGISEKTGWFGESSDQVPQFRDLVYPKEYEGTILDGEVLIDVPDCDCRVVQSVTGALPAKAIEWQLDNKFAYLQVFDIIYYKGTKVANLPLYVRKLLLADVVKAISSTFIRMSPIYVTNGKFVEAIGNYKLTFKKFRVNKKDILQYVTKIDNLKSFYAQVLSQGVEGLMIKGIDRPYEFKRGTNFVKLKPELTFDVVIMGYEEPEHYFEGKTLDEGGKWSYWEDAEDDSRVVIKPLTGEEGEEEGLFPITKYTAYDWIGAVKFGVWKETHLQYFIDKYGSKYQSVMKELKEQGLLIEGEKHHRLLVEVGKTSGMNDKARKYMSEHQEELLGQVIEVRAQCIIDPKTGSLQHPRFKSFRKDKNSRQCIFEDHLIAGGIDVE